MSEVDAELKELALVRLGQADHGWVGGEAKLSDEGSAKLAELLGALAQPNQVRRIEASMARAFASAVKTATFCRQLQVEIDETATAQGRKRRPPRKFGVILRDYVRNLRGVVDQARAGQRRVQLDDVLNDVERFSTLSRLVTLYLEERIRPAIIDPLRRAPEKSAEFLPEVLEQIEGMIDAGVKSGPARPELTLLAESVVDIIRAETGKLPGRTWDAYTGSEKGTGLEICQFLARELNAQLPPDCKTRPDPDMSKPYRKAIEALR